MIWGVLIIIVIMLIGYISSITDVDANKKNNRVNRNVKEEASKMASEITTIKQFRSLERKLANAENRMSEEMSEKVYENASHRHDVLQEAITLTESKIYQWQYIPKIDLFTDKQTLENAYKVFTPEEYLSMKNSLSTDESDWYGIDGSGDKEEKDSYISSLLKFRNIVESNESRDDIINKINKLVSRSKLLREDFFDSDSPLKAGEQWYAEQLQNKGLPLAQILYSEGYTTPKKCLEIDPSDFMSRKGVGPKKLEQFKKFQAKVRSNSL